MSLPLADLWGPAAGAGGAASLVFFALKWAAEWISGRMDKKEARLDRIQSELLEQLRDDVGKLKTENAELRRDIDRVQSELIECRQDHATANGKIAELEGILQGKGQASQQAQQIIAANRHASSQAKEG